LESNSYRFLGKAPLRRVFVVHRFVVLSILAILIGLSSVVISPSTKPSRLTGVAPTPTATVSYQFSISELIEYLNSSNAGRRKWAAQCLAEKGAEAKQAIPALRSKLKDKDREVRAAAQAALAKISPNSGSAKKQLRQIEAEISPIENQLGSLKAQIDSHAATIRRYEIEINLGYEVDRDSYKNTVARHNSLVEEHNQLLAEYRSIVAKHKALVGETNEKVNRYNNLVRGQR